MWTQELIEELKSSWNSFHIQSLVILNVIIAVLLITLYWGEEIITIYDGYLDYVAMLLPVFLLILFAIRSRTINDISQLNHEQLFWWSLTDIAVGSGVFLVWLFLRVVGPISFGGAILVYINILAYIVLLMTFVIMVYTWNNLIISVIAGLLGHGGLLFMKEVVAAGTLMNLRLLPHQLISDFSRTVSLVYGFSEIVTPLAVTGVLILFLRKMSIRQLPGN